MEGGKKILLLITILAALNHGLLCQVEKQLMPADLKQQTIVTEPVTLYKGFLRTGFHINYRVADKYFDGSGSKEYFTSSTWGSNSALNFALQYGLTDRLEINIVSEYLNNRFKETSTEVSTGTNTTTSDVTTRKGIGFGDTHLTLKYQIFREKRNKVSLTGIVNGIFPTGEKNPTNIKNAMQYDLPVGNGAYALTGTLLARSIIYPYSFTAFLNYTRNFSGTKKLDPSDPDEKEFRFGNRLETGISTNLHLNEWIVFTNEFGYYHEGAGSIDNVISPRLPASWAVVYEPNLYFQVKKFRLGESVTIPVKGKNVPADPLFIIQVQYIF